jgi:hypothetical protein
MALDKINVLISIVIQMITVNIRIQGHLKWRELPFSFMLMENEGNLPFI